MMRMCIKNSNNSLREIEGLVRDRSCVDWEQSTFKQQQIWEPGAPDITFETARTKPRNI